MRVPFFNRPKWHREHTNIGKPSWVSQFNTIIYCVMCFHVLLCFSSCFQTAPDTAGKHEPILYLRNHRQVALFKGMQEFARYKLIKSDKKANVMFWLVANQSAFIRSSPFFPNLRRHFVFSPLFQFLGPWERLCQFFSLDITVVLLL